MARRSVRQQRRALRERDPETARIFAVITAKLIDRHLGHPNP